MTPEDFCNVCGWRGRWVEVDSPSVRENLRCGGCRSSARYRNQAASIVQNIARGRHVTLRDMVRDPALQDLAVFEPALHGPFIRYFQTLPHYMRTYFREHAAPGAEVEGVRSEDLTALTFADESFDLIVSSDVMEHVFDYPRAFRELHRVLRPGGLHVCTIPLAWPLPERTVERATLVAGEVIHHKPSRFHRSGDGLPCLVCTDFGYDLLGLLAGIGYDSWFERPSMGQYPAHSDALLVSRKPGTRRGDIAAAAAPAALVPA